MNEPTAADVVAALGGLIADDLDSPSPTCVLCQTKPCSCPAFGTAEYFALIAKRHGKGAK